MAVCETVVSYVTLRSETPLTFAEARDRAESARVRGLTRDPNVVDVDIWGESATCGGEEVPDGFARE